MMAEYRTGSCGVSSGVGSDSEIMAELAALLRQEIPEGRGSLADSHTNLERVAEYCEANYFQAENKRIALEETKNYTTQSLASVAYQINTLAYNFLQLLDLQTSQLDEMESQMNHIAQTVMIHKEKVARREIGVLTANKMTSRQYKIIAPANPEKPIKYVRKSIDYTILDEIGHGVRGGGTPRSKQRGGSQGSVQSLGVASQSSALAATIVGPAPTTKPPTPPQSVRTGTLSKGSREYRTPPAVAPPQVPSHYAPNYPLGHPRRERGPGYSTLPLHSHTTQHQTLITNHNTMINPGNQHTSPPQVGTVHPLQSHPQTPPPAPPSVTGSTNYIQIQDQHNGMPPPPSPLVGMNSDVGDYTGHHTLPHRLSHQVSRSSGANSPPLPPPPPPENEEHSQFGRPPQSSGAIMPIVPDEEDLPGWVPKNYIEKVVAIYDYYADKEDELSFQESSVIYVLKKNDDGWWEGVMDGITGLFPGNYVEPCV
ncbi:abl interactor 2-like isoform X2 [Leptopilina boulardi]|uniref:abl interactor 2-like isoform X2 n=1 Tax=Leptopilina boulardi TaxID=63433 RepID=UPI0021F64C69|nr:abl interactor 2-like isoform X2 [Leptopilina boulardi]